MEDTTGCQINVNLGQATHSAKSTLTGNISKVYPAVETKLVILFPYTANATASSEGGEVDQSKPSYEMFDKEEKEKVKTLLFILDRFSISMKGNHYS